MGEIRTDIGRIARELAPCGVAAADIAWDTPDERGKGFLSRCLRAAQAWRETQS